MMLPEFAGRRLQATGMLIDSYAPHARLDRARMQDATEPNGGKVRKFLPSWTRWAPAFFASNSGRRTG
jgi:hypothetical protein